MSATPGPPPPQKSADEVLPPVEAPSKGFLLQLFFIPLVIVSIIVTLWFTFSWLSQMGADPSQLARNLKQNGSNRWQDAKTLSDLLSNPEFEELKDDVVLARELSDVLQEQLQKRSSSTEQVNMRVFLCRAVGEFHTIEVLPALIEAAKSEQQLSDIEVRRSALEAIAVLADNIGPEKLRDNTELYAALRGAALERSNAGEDKSHRAALRETAAFTLGVVGGADAMDTLARVLDDPNANARYNAATGLARHGDVRAAPVLLEMLDTDNEYAVANETTRTGKDWKRMQVARNGIIGARRLAEQNKSADLSELETALREFAESDLELFLSSVRRGLRLAAAEALESFENRSQTTAAK